MIQSWERMKSAPQIIDSSGRDISLYVIQKYKIDYQFLEDTTELLVMIDEILYSLHEPSAENL